MRPLRALIVDDEPLARATLLTLLESDRDMAVVGQCGTGRDALCRIAAGGVDVAFLDIEMPDGTGLDVAASLTGETAPAVVFVTAYDEHATRAFELEAVDYVLKPFSEERFAATVARVKRRLEQQALGENAPKTSNVALELGGSPRLVVRKGSRRIVISVSEVLWIGSEDYYVRIHTREDSHLLRTPLSTLEQQLARAGFCRVHRSALVNLYAICELRLGGGLVHLVLVDGSEVPVSRKRRPSVERQLAALGRSPTRM